MKLLVRLLCLGFLLGAVNAQKCGNGAIDRIPYSVVPEDFCPYVWASGLNRPRGITVASNGDVLVVEGGLQRVTVLWEDSSSAAGAPHRATLAEARGLNHGVLIGNDGFLYASSPSSVYRWKYTVGQHQDLGDGQLVIKNIPDKHHVTRSLQMDSHGKLYVQSGSASNVDPSSINSRIKRFQLPSTVPHGGIDWLSGELFADGTRNTVGIDFDDRGILWGVENGVDNAYREDLGGDIHTNNPSEEVNEFDVAGRFYGYPYCWSEYELKGNVTKTPGTQYVDQKFQHDGTHSDAWCRDTSNVTPPRFNMPAHIAPLGMKFYNGQLPGIANNTFPSDFTGDAFVGQHGSWNRKPADGYRIDRLHFENHKITGISHFFRYQGPGATGQNWPHRPVGVAVTRTTLGESVITASDRNGLIIAVVYEGSR